MQYQTWSVRVPGDNAIVVLVLLIDNLRSIYQKEFK